MSTGKKTAERELITSSADETEKAAERYAAGLKRGDCVALSGSLGSGKTTFVKGLAKGLGIREVVKSPTFNLLHVHSGARLALYHFDLYRLEESDLEELGFTEYIFETDGVAVLEWADRVRSGLPPKTRWVHFQYVDENRRKISFRDRA